jgi:PTH1 family peptidyl-tRNA hydrolase
MPIKMVVGLGNPGKKYEGTRHNIGRRVIETLQEGPLRVSWLVTEKFMNESGAEVARAAKYQNIAPGEILVVLDEFQLPLRKISILQKGSDGGHNGLKSVLEWLGTENVPRMRIGIGPLPEHEDPAEFVLERFSNVEKPMLEQLMPEFENAVTTAVTQGLDAAMNQYNNRMLP